MLERERERERESECVCVSVCVTERESEQKESNFEGRIGNKQNSERLFCLQVVMWDLGLYFLCQ